MKKLTMTSIIFLFGVGIIFSFFLQRENKSPDKLQAENYEKNKFQNIPKISKNGNVKLDQPKKVPRNTNSKTEEKGPFQLTQGNFESFIQQCFLGEPCELTEDPMILYKEFKYTENIEANDDLIAFLRKQMKNPKFRDQYKDVLLQIIEDFYPPQEKQFQIAAYYNYLGDLQKSLDLYLDLEKKSEIDQSLRKAPKLNIANTFYDLGKFWEALPYYQDAREEFLVGDHRGGTPGTNTMVRFIDDRINKIESKIRL